ncbi:NAD-dependent DNA ligase LigA [Bulleidia sp. zg-1006]|uniref:NAD-dependent DNA ligase LigA n=1 Tax=Bulleidia sp. zg-1006 TaxID=2806552 RepID=UPI001939932B|nr:NAD-dependent DNA ligase LigA [Bulleidia sp. zg-1006]QRG86457.1 NAD-dependent DNA ligase LigA [Bulleidia sp. zg-1006]
MLEREKMQSLVQQLNKASDAYYNGRQEILSDQEWDCLFDELKKLEEKTGIILEDSPTQKVSADEIVGQKEAHEFPALSLAKTKSIGELVKWANHLPIWMSWKLDGLTLVVTYEKGKLLKVVTRGDGHIGTNITHLVDGLYGIAKEIRYKGRLIVRGEALISYADFEEYIRETGENYANPRNLASGSLSLKKASEVLERKIHFRPFTLVYCEKEMNSWGERMAFLEALGFDVVEHILIEKPNEESVQMVLNQFSEEVKNHKNPYPVDGLVIAYDDIVYASSGSVTGHHATRAGLAFKWADQSKISKLVRIEWSNAISTITPVAIFEPVELEGTTVQRASLVNISECERLGIGSSGTEVEVIKANMIIPKVISVVKKVGEFDIPKLCPVCQQATKIHISEVSETKSLKCTNSSCPAKALKKYVRFVSKQGMDIDGISEATLSTFIAQGWIKNYGDIYRLKDRKEEIAQLEGFGEKSAENILASLEKAKTVRADKFLFALSISLVGIDVASRLLHVYPLKELISLAREKEGDFFSHIDGIGPQKSEAFVRWMKEEDKQKELEDLFSFLQVEDLPAIHHDSDLNGLTFVVTGDVQQFKNRNELKEWISARGGRVASAVSGSTDFLINNDVESSSSKNMKAKALGIPILSEMDFITRFIDK